MKALWYLPLAIVQAGATIAESGTLDTYLDLFAKDQTRLLRTKPAQSQDDYGYVVYTTWEKSFSKLTNAHRRESVPVFRGRSMYNSRGLLYKLEFNLLGNVDLGSPQSRDLSEVEMTNAREFLSNFVGPTGQWDSTQFLEITNELYNLQV
ncbi:hypothetical protein C8R45DRAFT_936635 [Mycena sanguinolenta]|nr:hypothetical protein C8R45DRAFT_936635 [Mycena sanguinolenta]